jgi:hypothetical protein
MTRKAEFQEGPSMSGVREAPYFQIPFRRAAEPPRQFRRLPSVRHALRLETRDYHNTLAQILQVVRCRSAREAGGC